MFHHSQVRWADRIPRESLHPRKMESLAPLGTPRGPGPCGLNLRFVPVDGFSSGFCWGWETFHRKNTVDGRNAANQFFFGGLCHYLQEFIHPRWCKISAINSRNRYNGYINPYWVDEFIPYYMEIMGDFFRPWPQMLCFHPPVMNGVLHGDPL